MSVNDNEKLASEGRRLLLKSLAAGGAAAAFLPDKWTKPVIDRILVPAHAQGSPGLYGIYTNNGSGTLGSNFQPSMFERLANMIIPVANAQDDGLPLLNSLCIALDVKTNNSVIGYVVGSTGTSLLDAKSLKIADFDVGDCGGKYKLSNCVIYPGGAALTGYIAHANSTSYGYEFRLTPTQGGIPINCSICNLPT